MKAHTLFTNELNKLLAFYKATTYAFEQAENLLQFWKQKKYKFDEHTEIGLILKQPHYYKLKKNAKNKIRQNLTEIVFVRVVSALEVFLVDLIRDTFLENKEPFKKQDILLQFTQAELLSIKSPAEIFNKVINKECRKLTNGGFNDIIKYYKRHFDIYIASIAPGKSKMEEYHDRRHLLVHRLGKTDQQYREKYNTAKHGISIDEEYLYECIEDFRTFSELLTNQIIYKLKHDFTTLKSKAKIPERKLTLKVELLKNKEPECFQSNFEFWAGDDFSMFSDILDEKKRIGTDKLEFDISGTFRQIKSYSRIIKSLQKKKEINIEKIKESINHKITSPPSQQRILDDEIIDKVREKLPEQPWEKGIHKKIATELNISNKLVSLAIQQLIVRKIFNQQINGKIIIDEDTDIKSTIKNDDNS